MSFEERLHPRAGDGKFTKGGGVARKAAGDLKVTSRRRNGDAVDDDAGADPVLAKAKKAAEAKLGRPTLTPQTASKGDRVEHAQHGPGTITRANGYEASIGVKFDSGDEKTVWTFETAKAGGKPDSGRTGSPADGGAVTWRPEAGGHLTAKVGDHLYRVNNVGGGNYKASMKGPDGQWKDVPGVAGHRYDDAKSAVERHAAGSGGGGSDPAAPPKKGFAGSTFADKDKDHGGGRSEQVPDRKAMKKGYLFDAKPGQQVAFDTDDGPRHGTVKGVEEVDRRTIKVRLADGSSHTVGKNAASWSPKSGGMPMTSGGDAPKRDVSGARRDLDAVQSRAKPMGRRDDSERVVSRDGRGAAVKDTAAADAGADPALQRAKSNAEAKLGRPTLTPQTAKALEGKRVEHVRHGMGTLVKADGYTAGVYVKFDDGVQQMVEAYELAAADDPAKPPKRR